MNESEAQDNNQDSAEPLAMSLKDAISRHSLAHILGDLEENKCEEEALHLESVSATLSLLTGQVTATVSQGRMITLTPRPGPLKWPTQPKLVNLTSVNGPL